MEMLHTYLPESVPPANVTKVAWRNTRLGTRTTGQDNKLMKRPLRTAVHVLRCPRRRPRGLAPLDAKPAAHPSTLRRQTP